MEQEPLVPAESDRHGLHWRRELLPLALAVAACYLLAAMLSYTPSDPAWTTSGSGGGPIGNWGGPAGAWLVDVLFHTFGQVSYLLAVALLGVSYQLLRGGSWRWHGMAGRSLALVVFLCTSCALAALVAGEIAPVAGGGMAQLFGPPQAFCSAVEGPLPCGAGGFVGLELGRRVAGSFGGFGARLLLSAAALLSLSWVAHLSWLATTARSGDWLRRALGAVLACAARLALWLATVGRRAGTSLWTVLRYRSGRLIAAATALKRVSSAVPTPVTVAHSDDAAPPSPSSPAPHLSTAAMPPVAPVPARRPPAKVAQRVKAGGMPSIELLDQSKIKEDVAIRREELAALGQRLEGRLSDFGISAEVVSIHPGPVITRFEIRPAAGIKVSRISALAKDLARSLAVISVRVVEVIPGKSVVGIEVPNEHRQLVTLHDVLASSVWRESTAPLSFALGHDISGRPVVVDLSKMPHLLVAGTTGAGKSVGINAMLLSLLLKSPPEQVRLILVDPKMLELAVYEGIPHLLTPVITDMKDAARGLRWCVAEMERRYQLMAALGVRNMDGYNRRVRQALEAGQAMHLGSDGVLLEHDDEALVPPEELSAALEPLPFIVVVIDEFADMMMIVGKKVEQLIARIAQKARAAGIHLVLATQRPSVDVITGLIKANIPSRIAYQVPAKVDARTIMDQAGAEQLLGHGDMLYLPAGGSVPMRVHGAFVADDEVHRVVAVWKKQSESNYLSEVLEGVMHENTGDFSLPDSRDGGSENDAADPLYDQALSFVVSSRRGSISAVQRKLRIGYNRAARLLETMEQTGVVSAMESNGSREVLAPEPQED